MTDDSSKRGKGLEPVDVFLSYRRLGGATAASFLSAELKSRGLRVFMDVESLTVGDFEQAIVESISAANNFLLIVTDNVFESVHVNKEIEVALRLAHTEGTSRALQIIPIFVNGLTDFPQNMPVALEPLRLQNAVTLNHVAFQESLDKLFGWLVTRHNQFIDAWVNYRKYYGEKPLDFLLHNLTEVFPTTKPDIEAFLIRKYRQQWINSGRQTRKAISDLVDSLGIWHIKEFLERLGIEHRGSSKLIKKNIENWLYNNETKRPIEDDDRFYTLVEYLKVAVYSSKPRQKELNDLCRSLDVDLSESDQRSSWDVLCEYFYQSRGDVTYILAEMNLNSSDINAVAKAIWGTSSGTKAELIKEIAKWVDYKI